MTYAALDPQPKPRAEEDLTPDRHDVPAPGLYPGELALQLDDGTLVAASVDQEWQANGAGVNFKACARWIDADGATHVCGRGQHVETLASQGATVEQVAAWGTPALALVVLNLVLGEPPRLMKLVPVDGADPEQRPVFDVPDHVRASYSIRAAVAVVGSTPAQADLGALLTLAEKPAPPAQALPAPPVVAVAPAVAPALKG